MAQSQPIPLNYNFNGILHATESGLPDAPAGFRSISDRALDFSAGVPVDPLLAPYQIVATPNTLDCVHLGNRNTVDNSGKIFDATPNGDDIGIQPTWLVNVDQTGPQETILPVPMPIGPTTTATFLYQISNGGGSFDVVFTFFSGKTYTASLAGPDWYGGTYAGTAFVDNGFSDFNLSITEGKIDLTSQIGEVVQKISFANRSNSNAGYAIFAAKFDYPPVPRLTNQIALNYNFNGIVHATESGAPDAPAGYRSISDRGLDFTAGVPNDSVLNRYKLVDTAGALDIVHLGNRNAVSGGGWAFDPTPNGDNIGVQPTWLTNVDQSTPQTTTLANPILLDAASSAALIYQISNGGGSFDLTLTFRSGKTVVTSLSGADWFGGNLLGTDSVDSGLPGANLSVTERTVDISAHAGEVLTDITFSNASNTSAGYAILGMNVTGCIACGKPGGKANLGGGNGASLSTVSNGNLGCDLEWNLQGASPNAAGFMLIGFAPSNISLGAVFPGCTAALKIQNPFAVGVAVNAAGSYDLKIKGVINPSLCGLSIHAQYIEILTAPCPFLMSDAVAITIGD